jgi:glycosyltransferase involved in cell wall biosynthesis
MAGLTLSKGVNIVFLGIFPYPHGLAATKRIQHSIDGLKVNRDVSMHVVVLRQLRSTNRFSGTYKGTSYETVIEDATPGKRIFLFPTLYIRAARVLKRLWRADCKNIIYNYGPTKADNLIPLCYGKHLGYKIVFDIVEDYNTATGMSDAFFQRLNIRAINRLSSQTLRLAKGIIVISKHLESKYRNLTQGWIPLHYRPISINMDCFTDNPAKMNRMVSLFYAGSFGKKDGLPVLLDAFDRLAAKRNNVKLVLSGRGESKAMEVFFSRVKSSPYKDRIEYKGYLDDDSYYSLLNSADIHCMTRIDIAYAHAGFPFKLGEFLASGKPVIASRVSDIHDLLIERKNAMLVKPGDSEEIVRAAEYLMDNPETAERIGEAGRQVATSLFDYRAQGKSLFSFLKEL